MSTEQAAYKQALVNLCRDHCKAKDRTEYLIRDHCRAIGSTEHILQSVRATCQDVKVRTSVMTSVISDELTLFYVTDPNDSDDERNQRDITLLNKAFGVIFRDARQEDVARAYGEAGLAKQVIRMFKLCAKKSIEVPVEVIDCIINVSHCSDLFELQLANQRKALILKTLLTMLENFAAKDLADIDMDPREYFTSVCHCLCHLTTSATPKLCMEVKRFLPAIFNLARKVYTHETSIEALGKLCRLAKRGLQPEQPTTEQQPSNQEYLWCDILDHVTEHHPLCNNSPDNLLELYYELCGVCVCTQQVKAPARVVCLTTDVLQLLVEPLESSKLKQPRHNQFTFIHVTKSALKAFRAAVTQEYTQNMHADLFKRPLRVLRALKTAAVNSEEVASLIKSQGFRQAIDDALSILEELCKTSEKDISDINDMNNMKLQLNVLEARNQELEQEVQALHKQLAEVMHKNSAMEQHMQSVKLAVTACLTSHL